MLGPRNSFCHPRFDGEKFTGLRRKFVNPAKKYDFYYFCQIICPQTFDYNFGYTYTRILKLPSNLKLR